MLFLNNVLHGASLSTVLAGKSIIDHPNLQIPTIEDAEAFIECYGYELKTDQAELNQLQSEALHFLNNIILAERVVLPEEIVNNRDIRKLLVWSSTNKKSELSKWSCSLLKIIHTMAHCTSFFIEQYQQEICDQIYSNLTKHIVNKDDAYSIGDVELVHFSIRPLKTKESATIKLLHKPENVSVNIYDWLGIRIVTKYRLDAIKVLTYLRANNVVMYANVKPSRSRNTLVDLDWLMKNAQSDSFNSLRQKLQHLALPTEQGNPITNKHTTSNYHSLQFTCRQRIKITEANGNKLKFFFPFEIQIIDEDSYMNNKDGAASHTEYKKRQLDAVRKRVLGTLYSLYF